MINIIKLLSIFTLITLVGCQHPLDSERQFEDKYSDETLTRIGNILDKNPNYECLTYKMWVTYNLSDRRRGVFGDVQVHWFKDKEMVDYTEINNLSKNNIDKDFINIVLSPKKDHCS